MLRSCALALALIAAESVSAAAQAPFDVQAVVRRAHFSFRQEDGRLTGGHSTYGVEVDGRKVSVRPVDARITQGDVRAGPPLILETTAIARGTRDLRTADVAAADENGRLVRGGPEVQELLENKDEGLELSWRFAAAPRGDGDVVVQVAASGLDYAGETGGGLHFRETASPVGVRFGRAAWIDADGRRTDVRAQWDGRTVRLDVPADVVAHAAYPAVLDPLLGPERAIDTPVFGPGSNGQTTASVAYDSGTGEYLVVWTDLRASAFPQVIGTRVSAGGAVLDPNGIVLSTLGIGASSASAVFEGTDFLVVFALAGGGVQGRRVSIAGQLVDLAPFSITSSFASNSFASAIGSTTLVVWEESGDIKGRRINGPIVVDPTPFIISSAPNSQSVPTIAAGSGSWLVAWQDSRNGVATDIYGARVSASTGAVVDPAGIAISTAAGDQTAPWVASNGTDYFVVFQDQRNASSDVYGARVTSAGLVSDPAGLQLSNSPFSESAPSVAFGGGNYQVVWANGVGGLSGNRVVPGTGAILDGSNGAAITGVPAGNMNNPRIFATGAAFYMAWDQFFPASGAVLGSRVTTAPALLDAPGVRLAFSANGEYNPSVAASASDYFVAWLDNRGGSRAIFGARVNGTTGVSMDPSGILVASASASSIPAVAFNGTEYLVAWLDTSQDVAIYGKRVTTAGTVVDASALRLYGSPSAQIGASPTMASDGTDWFVTWADGRNVATTSFDVFGGRVSGATGAPLDGPGGIAISTAPGIQVNPRVAYGGGVYLVTWVDGRSGGSGQEVYGEELTASTGALLQPSTVNLPIDTTPSPTLFVASSAYAAPNFMVVDDKDATIRRVRVAAAGGAVVDTAALTGCCNYSPQIAYDGSTFVVVYLPLGPSGYGLRGTRVDLSGVDLDATDFDIVFGSGVVLGFPSEAIASTAGAVPQSLVVYSRYDSTSGVTSDRLRTRIITPLADLSLTKTDGSVTASVGSPVTYTIVASNAGPGNVQGATVTDTVPAILVGATWTCAGANGGTCTASGSGDISDTVDLPVGGTATYTLTGTLSQSAGATLSNTASVTAPAGATDPNPGNNSATDTDTVVREADLALTKTDGHSAAVAGQPITYTIVATNAGPSDATGATVTDTVPAAILTPAWTCGGAGGGTCTASGSGNINDVVSLPAGSSVTYVLTGTISGAATGSLSNTASITPPAGVTDPNTANNSATDTDPLFTLGPNNDTPSGAKDLQIGAVSSDTLGAPPNAQNWFRYAVQAGRSYCVDVDNGRSDVSIRDTVLSVFRADATTIIGTNDDIADEPGGSLLSRVCYIATGSEDNLAKVTAGASPSGTAGGIRVRVVDTTLFCPWFFSGNGFEAFVLIKNTTGTVHNATVRLAGPDGTTLGTQSGIAPADGSYNLQVSAASPTGFGLATASGGVYIAHDGPPGSLIANVTSLSFGSGVSFDTPASPRQDSRP